MGDFLAGEILADEFEDPAFGRSEGFDLRFVQQQALHATAPFSSRFEHHRADVGFARDHFFEGGHDVVGGIVFDDVGFGAQVHGGVEDVLFLVHGENDGLDCVRDLSKPAEQIQSIQSGHVDVNYRNVRLQTDDQANGFVAIRRFGDDAKARIFHDDVAHAAPQQGMVINDQYG